MTGGVDELGAIGVRCQIGTDLGDAPVDDGDVGPEPRCPRAVDDGPAMDDQSGGHARTPSFERELSEPEPVRQIEVGAIERCAIR